MSHICLNAAAPADLQKTDEYNMERSSKEDEDLQPVHSTPSNVLRTKLANQLPKSGASRERSDRDDVKRHATASPLPADLESLGQLEEVVTTVKRWETFTCFFLGSCRNWSVQKFGPSCCVSSLKFCSLVIQTAPA